MLSHSINEPELAPGRPKFTISQCEESVRTIQRSTSARSTGTSSRSVHDFTVSAAHHLGRFVEALGITVSVGGDCDTNAAIVCGIVALSAGAASIPAEWLKARGFPDELYWGVWFVAELTFGLDVLCFVVFVLAEVWKLVREIVESVRAPRSRP